MFPGNITVFRTYGKRRSNRDIRKAVICQNLLDEITTNFCGRNTLVHIKVKHRTAGIFGLAGAPANPALQTDRSV